MSTNNEVDDFDVEALVAAKSDQLNAADLTGGAITVRVLKVKKGKPEQPMAVHIEGYRPWMPCKGMRRVLIDLWGPPSPAWLGRTIRLYREPSVKWAGEEAGGIRVSGMSDIKASCTVPVAVSRGVNVKMRIEKLAPVSGNTTQRQAAPPPGATLVADVAKLLDVPAEVVTKFFAAVPIIPEKCNAADVAAILADLQPGGPLRERFEAGPGDAS